ncbi:hypothetical protein [Vulcanisaeta distributa]|uniref:hypothetical protein n=1 Tax=Vulcanisaeta distributa TaxID=164451 RepID=UPI0006D14062|nr:hypothetical protein [Vulcanisaeta distributa]
MPEPILKLKPFTAGSEVGKMVLAMAVTSALWYGIGYLLPQRYHVPLWELALIQLFFALFMALEIWELIKNVKERRVYIKDFILYKDYVWFATVKGGDEVTIPIEEFNPCVVKYASPLSSYPYQVNVSSNSVRAGWTWNYQYYPGRVWLKISHYGEDYILHIDTEQCRRLNQVLNIDFGKPRIDWCGGRVVKDMGKFGRIERPGLAC